MALTEKDFAEAAKLLGCDTAAVKAVTDVESGGSGFYPDGKVKVLFEGHHFYRLTRGKFAKTHPTLCYPKWTRVHYRKGPAEYGRLLEAIALDREAALKSASFGRFQIMGFNHESCGFATVEAFFQAMSRNEGEQLVAFCRFVERAGLAQALRNQDWAKFARGYNGPKFRDNHYDTKLEAAHKKHCG